MDSVELLAYIMAGGRLFCGVMGSGKTEFCATGCMVALGGKL